MLQQAMDFRAESDALFALLDRLDEQDWQRTTQFKNWTINDVVAHLHIFNYAADLSLTDIDAFTRLMRDLAAASKRGASHLAFTHEWLKGTKNRALIDRWCDFYQEMATRFELADPRKRVPWAGPDMSVRSSITARLMETWAHGQAIYDVLGEERSNTDRIKNIAVLGIKTFGWTFANRGMAAPANRPYVRLIAPSGEVWEWGEPDDANFIDGSAIDFCQVVTQVRNVADTKLKAVGTTAAAWMSMAQCFAGPSENPPPPGTRFCQRRPSQV